jgi:hypothetical protein
MTNRGGPRNPLSVEELTVKFLSNATRVMDERDARTAADAIVHMADRPLRSVLQLAAAPGVPAL